MTALPDSTLFDIEPVSETVTAGGKRHKITGVPFRVFLRIGKNWPPLVRLLTGGAVSNEEFADAPEAVAQFIAAGFGLADNEQAIEKASNLPLDVQMDLFIGILQATTGGGGRPFAERTKAIAELMAGKSAQNSEPELEKSVTNGDASDKSPTNKSSSSSPKRSSTSSTTATTQ